MPADSFTDRDAGHADRVDVRSTAPDEGEGEWDVDVVADGRVECLDQRTGPGLLGSSVARRLEVVSDGRAATLARATGARGVDRSRSPADAT